MSQWGRTVGGMSSNDDLPPRPPLPDVPPPVGTIERDGLAPAAAEFADVADARDRLAARALGLLMQLRRDPAGLDGCPRRCGSSRPAG